MQFITKPWDQLAFPIQQQLLVLTYGKDGGTMSSMPFIRPVTTIIAYENEFEATNIVGWAAIDNSEFILNLYVALTHRASRLGSQLCAQAISLVRSQNKQLHFFPGICATSKKLASKFPELKIDNLPVVRKLFQDCNAYRKKNDPYSSDMYYIADYGNYSIESWEEDYE